MKKRKGSVLIVDDDVCVVKTMSSVLEDEGFEFDIAYNGKEALEKAKDKSYDVALLDINLPDMKGTQLLKAIGQGTVKIMVTAYPESQTSLDALKWGADGYLIKPIDPNEVIKTMDEKLQKLNESRKMTEEKLAEFIRERGRKLLKESE
jgi:two-component system alkaline phosphatase synthesis response regulator PhoP